MTLPTLLLKLAAGARQTPLHAACAAGPVAVVEELLKRGANYKLPDDSGMSAYVTALMYDRDAVINFMHSHPRVGKSVLRRSCANCDNSVDLTEPTYKVCARCRTVRYCWRKCQKEHWKRVHKKHCKEIASAGQLTTYHELGDQTFYVTHGIFSHLPFSASELPRNPTVALLMLSQRILTKMQFRNQSVYTKVSNQLAQLQAEMTKFLATTWANKKIYPEKFCSFCDLSEIFCLYTKTSITADKELCSQDLWSTLHLVLGRLSACDAVHMVHSLKDPRGVVPAKLWIGFYEEVGPLPSRVAELIKALSGDQFPSFQELLKIFCGGTLRQTCSFCKKRLLN